MWGVLTSLYSRKADLTKIRHLMLRSTATLIVMTHMQDRRDKENRAQSIHANLGSLRHVVSSRRRLRKDIILGITYNMIYLAFNELLSCISLNSIWTTISQLAIGVALSNLHLRWTGVVLSSRTQTGSRIFSLPHRDLILPSGLYILAWDLTAKLPVIISKALSVQESNTLGGLKIVALADAIILIASLSLRLLLLYPVYTTYIYTETKLLKSQDVAGSRPHMSAEQADSPGMGLGSYAQTWRKCFKRTAPWFALLHLQTVFVLAVLELMIAPLLELLVF
jgi:hypothetical protein